MGNVIRHKKIGVFDSGRGGKSVALAIEKALPYDEIIFRDDHEHVPYGLKSPEEILGFIIPIFQDMIDEGCDVIVIACNTVSTTLIGTLRERFSIPLVGVEPMVKPAAELTKSKIIAVCATPTTLKSSGYARLKTTYAHDLTVLEPDCSEWAFMIEHNTIGDEHIRTTIQAVIDQGADVIVLACTHYHWIEDKITSLAHNHAVVLQPEQAIIRQLKRVLQT